MFGMDLASTPCEIAQRPTGAADAEHCPVCGARRTAEDRFCIACGCEVEAPATPCARCDFPLRPRTRFCIRCGAPVPNGVTLPASAPRRAENANSQLRPVTSHTLPIAITALGCALAVGVYLSLNLGKTRPQGASFEQHRAAPREFTSGTLGRTRANTEDFSVRRALTELYGNYDPNLDGAFWQVPAAPSAFSEWGNRPLFIRPLISRSFEEHGLARHVLVTNSLDVKRGEIVKQGTGCRLCRSLIGAAIFERRGHGWQLISRHDFLTAGGRWGAPPLVSIAFPAAGGVQLRFDGFATDSGERSATRYSIVLKERESSKAPAVPLAGRNDVGKAGTSQR